MNEPRRESPSGYHFWNLFQNCERKFQIKYVHGFQPLHTAPPLVFGAEYHEATANFYVTGGDENGSIDLFQENKAERQHEYRNQEYFARDYMRGPLLLRKWFEKHGHNDLKFYNILAIEEEIRPTLANGFIMTMRPDRIMESKIDGRIYIFDTKTSSFSVTVTQNEMRLGDQATSYLLGVERCYDFSPDGFQTDICYQNQSVIKCVRPDLVYRSDRDLREFEYGAVSKMAEISQKVKNLQKYPWYYLFSRNTQWCTSYAKPCEYADICRMDLGDVPPSGFKKDPWSDYEALMKASAHEIKDQIEVELV